MRGVVVVVAAAMALGGCIRAERHKQELAEASGKEDAFCREIGARPGSDAYVNCRTSMRSELLRKHASENARAREGVVCTPIAGVGTVCN